MQHGTDRGDDDVLLIIDAGFAVDDEAVVAILSGRPQDGHGWSLLTVATSGPPGTGPEFDLSLSCGHLKRQVGGVRPAIQYRTEQETGTSGGDFCWQIGHLNADTHTSILVPAQSPRFTERRAGCPFITWPRCDGVAPISRCGPGTFAS